MTYQLAIFAPVLGVLTETFIQRHMQELLPGGTVVVAGTSGRPYGGYWGVDCPLLLLQQARRGSLKGQVARAAARALGWAAQERPAAVKSFLRQHGVRVAMGQYLDWSQQWLEVVQRAGVRFFGHAHGYDVSIHLREPKWRTAYLNYNQSDGIITVSQFSRAKLINLGLDASKIHVIPCGVDVPPQRPVRPEHDIVRCLTVGRMVAKKAPILTLDAFRRAAKRNQKLRLDYVGGGELLPAAQQFVRAFRLEERVTLHGGQPKEMVQRLMKRADVFLQHSMTDPETGDEEGLPVSILEAMANGLPVVSTRHAGIPEAVAEGTTGYLVQEGDSVAMADRLTRVAEDFDLRRRMGEAGWQRVKEHFSWERERAELLRILGLGFSD